MSQYNCPVCHAELKPELFSRDREVFVCPNCKKQMQTEIQIVPYGIPLPSTGDVKAKFACPFCEQHYTIDQNWSRPVLHCDSCGNDFMIPKQFPEKRLRELQPPPWIGKQKQPRKKPKEKLPVAYYIVLGALLAAVAAFAFLFLF